MSKRLAENRLIITTPLILGIASFIVFGICFWSCNHAPYNYTEIIFAGPVLSLIGVIISIITTALLCGLLTIIKRLEFLDPVEKVVEELSMMEVYFHINNSGEKEMSQEISIVDITDLSERQRDSIAIVVNQIIELKPSILGVDVIFERCPCQASFS